MIIDNSNKTKNVDRNTEDKIAEFLTKAVSRLGSLVHGAVRIVKNWKKEAEKEKETFLKEQARMQSYRKFLQAQRSIQSLIALGLNNMPPHMKFLGNVSPHSIKVSQRDNGIIRAYVPCDMTDAPRHFHIFQNVLQDVLDSLHREAVDTLRDRIMADACHIADLILTGEWNALEETRVMKEYNNLYQSIRNRLFSVHVVSVQRQSGGISIDAEVVFNDGGLAPCNYPSNIRSVM